MELLTPCLLIAVAYLLGSVSFAVVTSRMFRLPDPRTFGSGNPGATNMLRGGNRTAALLTLIGDTLKGMLALWLAQAFLLPGAALDAAGSSVQTGLAQVNTVLALVALAAFLGHLYPVFFRFQGGKGVATAAGLLLVLHWPLGLGTLLVWVAVFLFTRVSSVAALSAAIMAPLFALLTVHNAVTRLVVLLMSVLLIWRHRSNIRKLLAGEEAAFKRR